jgi:hypothetical protein
MKLLKSPYLVAQALPMNSLLLTLGVNTPKYSFYHDDLISVGSNCNSWDGEAGTMMFNDKNSKWIFAYKFGPAIKSDSASVPVTFHDKYGLTSINLSKAVGGDSLNPFTTSASTSDSGTTSGASGNSRSGKKPPPVFTKVLMAHATILPLAFVVFYPFGAILIRLSSFEGIVWLHAGWMIFTYLTVLGGMSLVRLSPSISHSFLYTNNVVQGVWIAVILDELTTYHAIIGLVVTGALLLQPLTGLLHHLLFRRYSRSSRATYSHVWWGRAVITLGIINGGFGLQLAGNSRNGEIIYRVLAGFFWALWMGVVLLSIVRNRSRSQKEMGNKGSEPVSGSGEKGHSAEENKSKDSMRQNSTTSSVPASYEGT